MFQLIYASTAARQFRKEDLRALVDQARENNARLGVTGVLIYCNGSFMHVIEADDEETVRRLYEAIRQDDRHKGVTLLKASSLEERDFPGRPLAFRDRSVTGARQHPLADGEMGEDHLFGQGGVAHETLLQFQRTGTRPAPKEPAPAEKDEETIEVDASEAGASAGGSASDAAASS